MGGCCCGNGDLQSFASALTLHRTVTLSAAVSSPYYIMGCYNDFNGGWRMLPLLLSSSGINGIGVNSSCMAIELCAYIARNEGFSYFGVEAGTCA